MNYANIPPIEEYPPEEQKFFDEMADKLIVEATSWIGTPFQHQGQIKQVGVDCAHFVDICAAKVNYPGIELPHDYNVEEDGSLMLQLLDANRLELVPYEQRRKGHVVAFCDEALRNKDKPRHLAFISEVTPITTFIVEVGRRGGVRHRLNGWWNERIHSIWRPKLEVLKEWTNK